MGDFESECNELQIKLNPLILKLSKDLDCELKFNDSEYYYNNQIEYYNHRNRLNKHCILLENTFNNYLGLKKNKGLLSRLLNYKTVAVNFNETTQSIKIFIPLGKQGTNYYLPFLIVCSVLNDNDNISYYGTSWREKIYEVDPLF